MLKWLTAAAEKKSESWAAIVSHYKPLFAKWKSGEEDLAASEADEELFVAPADF